MDGDGSGDHSGYFEEHKNEEELFEVLELDVDDMENGDDNDNDESYNDATVAPRTHIKCETITRVPPHPSNMRDDADESSNYEYQDHTQMDESDFFEIDDGTDERPPSAKRAKTDSRSEYQQPVQTERSTTKLDGTESTTSVVGEFDIFGNYVAAVMKNMRKNDARQLQMKIVQLINSYDEDEVEAA